MQTVFLPVEVIARELISRAFLSTKLANNGNKIYVFEHTFFDRNGWNEKGIYIGKNCFRTEVPYDKKYFFLMKQAGIRVWYLDEEGGVYTGDKKAQENRLMTRLTPSDLKEDDKILSWGNWQKRVFKTNQSLAKIEVSGNPSFDIIQPKYHDSFREFDSNITNGLEDFILINTRFSIGNPKHDYREIFEDNQPYAKNLPKLYLEESFISDNQMFFEMLDLCIYLSKKLPNEHIVIRPHPAENIEIYKILTKKLENVSVIFNGGVESWIRKCKVLIHNGCTTAIQADIAKKKVISFVPAVSEYIPRIPNKIGIIATTKEEVLTAIDKSLISSNEAYIDTHSEPNSIDFIVNLIQKNNYDKENSTKKSDLFIKENIKDLLRGFFNLMLPRRLKKAFDYKEFSKIVELVQIANKHYNTNVNCKKIADGCYCIYK